MSRTFIQICNVSKHKFCIPFVYFFFTRLKNFKALFHNLLVNLGVPVFYCSIVFEVDFSSVIILFILHTSIYEIGYVYNDNFASSRFEQGSHKPVGFSNSIKSILFSRVLFILAFSGFCYPFLGNFELILGLSLSLSVLALFFVHNFQKRISKVINFSILRLFTFFGLSVYKFAPVFIPLLGVKESFEALVAVALFLGVPRTIVYALRKYSSTAYDWGAAGQDVVFAWSVITLPLISYVMVFSESNVAVIGFGFFFISFFFFVYRIVRKNMLS